MKVGHRTADLGRFGRIGEEPIAQERKDEQGNHACGDPGWR